MIILGVGTWRLSGGLAAGLVFAASSSFASPAATPATAVAASTTTAQSVSSIYTADHSRDPFIRPVAVSQSGSAAAAAAAAGGEPPEAPEFSIHALNLRAIMKDSSAEFALFSDPNSGGTFIFRKGRLYDPKNKPVDGVKGSIKIKQKTVTLQTEDEDVQVFRLGEDKDEPGGKPADKPAAAAAPAPPTSAASGGRE